MRPHHRHDGAVPASLVASGPAQVAHRNGVRQPSHDSAGRYPRRGTWMRTGLPLLNAAWAASQARVGNRPPADGWRAAAGSSPGRTSGALALISARLGATDLAQPVATSRAPSAVTACPPTTAAAFARCA